MFHVKHMGAREWQDVAWVAWETIYIKDIEIYGKK